MSAFPKKSLSELKDLAKKGAASIDVEAIKKNAAKASEVIWEKAEQAKEAVVAKKNNKEECVGERQSVQRLQHTLHMSGKRSTFAETHDIKKGNHDVSQSIQTALTDLRRGVTSVGKLQNQEMVEKKRQIKKAQNREAVNDSHEFLEYIRSIHDVCSEPINWHLLINKEEPFNKEGIGPNEFRAILELEEASPSLLGKLVPAADSKRLEQLEQNVAEARVMDRKLYAGWERCCQLANKVLNGDLDTYLQVLSDMNPFAEILELGSDFDFGTDRPDFMEVEFHAKTDKVLPKELLSLNSMGNVSSKSMSKAMRQDLAKDYICSCVLRTVREIFALLPVSQVVIHVIDTVQMVLGKEYEDTIVSVSISRDKMKHLKFDMIDAVDTMRVFECNMNYIKGQGFKAVPRIEYIDDASREPVNISVQETN